MIELPEALARADELQRKSGRRLLRTSSAGLTGKRHLMTIC